MIITPSPRRAGRRSTSSCDCGRPSRSFPLGRFGRAPGEATIAPFAHAIWVNGARRSPNGADAIFPSVGVGVLTPFDLLRIDIGRGLRDGRWTFSLTSPASSGACSSRALPSAPGVLW